MGLLCGHLAILSPGREGRPQPADHSPTDLPVHTSRNCGDGSDAECLWLPYLLGSSQESGGHWAVPSCAREDSRLCELGPLLPLLAYDKPAQGFLWEPP